jgi:predicted DNA-binding transcriptional regulator AlpA
MKHAGAAVMARPSALPTNLPPGVITREAAAEFASVSPNTFDKMVAEGTMPAARRLHGSRKGWIVSELREAIARLPRLAEAEATGADNDETWSDVRAP